MKPFIIFAGLASIALLALSPAFGANTTIWEPGQSLVDTTNFANLGPYYWFPNFNNPSAVTNAATDSFEARNLPSWLHLETRHAFIGKDDGGVSADTTPRTGYSFVENGAGTAGGATVGGQSNFNTLTLPGGVTGISGQVLETQRGLNNTTTQLQFRVLSGSPASFRIWVITDNGAGANFNIQRRLRVSLRNTVGAPLFGGDTDTSEAEALPGGFQLIQAGSSPQANNGTADAWSFLLSDVGVNDIVSVRPTGGAGLTNYAGFGGLIIQPVPEPSSAVLACFGGVAALAARRRRVGR